MNNVAIRVENLGKQYRIGGPQAPYRTIRETLVDSVKAPFRRAGRLVRGQGGSAADLDQRFWALRDVSFEVKRGEVVGIIGRNGAGKSTLLKILSRITEPTEGEAWIHGRVGSLLEVGTGFHPELTGRENVYLNGAILGMKRAEIGRRFDEIVNFAELEKFIDTPVKHYSSGMYVRLAFGVAANLDPEILLVDEVLAVGDADFQKKCLGRMGEVARTGRTVFFVSHSMGAIVSLTHRCLLIDRGAIVKDGQTADVVEAYQSHQYLDGDNTSDLRNIERYGTGRARFKSLSVVAHDSRRRERPYVATGGDLDVVVAIEAFDKIAAANVALIVYDYTGYRLIDANLAMSGNSVDLFVGQTVQVSFSLYDLLLRPGTYYLGLWLGRPGEDIDGIQFAHSLQVEPNPDGLVASKLFPGTYQVRFSHEIILQDGSAELDSDLR